MGVVIYDLDLSPAEIERRYLVALRDIRRGGTGEIARQTLTADNQANANQLKSAAVFAVMSQRDTTVSALARLLKRDVTQVWGHVCFLRKSQKVEVKRWVVSSHGRRMAVYGVK